MDEERSGAAAPSPASAELENIRVKVTLTVVRGRWSDQKLIGERHESFHGLMAPDEVPARVERMWDETRADVMDRFKRLDTTGVGAMGHV